MSAEPPTATSNRSVLLVISGPAGSGKTTLCNRLTSELPDVERLVTTTSRPPRSGEVHGVDYHFIDVAEFERKIAAGDFIEWARVHGRYYGSQRSHVLELLRRGKDLLLNIDVQGAEAFRRLSNEEPGLEGRVHSLFIKPASDAQLLSRLHHRGTDDAREIERRMHSAVRELSRADSFDHVMISGSMEEDYQQARQLFLKLRQQALSRSTSLPAAT